MRDVRRRMRLLALLLATLLAGADVAMAQLATTTVQDTIYSASGTPASGTVLVSWNAFTTAGGSSVPAGSTSASIGAGGVLTIALVPNAGATPLGSYYTAVLHLNDGTTSREYWVVPVTVPGGGPAKLAAIQNQVLPTSVAMQTVSRQYVDTAIARAVAGVPAASSSPYVLITGDTMTGPLVLPADPVSPNQAADKNYIDSGLAAMASAPVAASRLPLFGPSGAGHAAGAVPDPGATAGATRYLREDGTWAAPAGGGGGTMASQNANAVAITGGTIDGTVIGGTTPAAGNFTTINGVTVVANSTLTVGTTAVSANSCTSASTITMTGTASTNTIQITPNSDVSAVTGWSPGTGGQLYFVAWPTSNTVHYYVCNPTSSSITPGSSTVWNVGVR